MWHFYTEYEDEKNIQRNRRKTKLLRYKIEQSTKDTLQRNSQDRGGPSYTGASNKNYVSKKVRLFILFEATIICSFFYIHEAAYIADDSTVTFLDTSDVPLQ